MKDLISRQAVIDVIANHLSREYGLPADAMKGLAESRLKDIPSADQWIPCSERLPEEPGTYIVTEKEFSVGDRDHEGRYEIIVEPVEFRGDGEWARANFFEVIAYMPLPEPYKEESMK